MAETYMKVPKLRAKTAYGLLGQIARLIVEEPKRYNQGSWIAVKGNTDHALEGLPEKGFPACNTVGCAAGWVCALTMQEPPNYWDVEDMAAEILGLDDDFVIAWELFDEDACGPKPQTKAHALRGAKHIEKFRKKYRARLLRQKV